MASYWRIYIRITKEIQIKLLRQSFRWHLKTTKVQIKDANLETFRAKNTEESNLQETTLITLLNESTIPLNFIIPYEIFK